MRLRCNRCGSVNIKTDSDGTARCVHCGSENIKIINSQEALWNILKELDSIKIKEDDNYVN